MKKIIYFLFFLSLSSCDLLTTRNAEQPNTIGSSNIPAFSKEILFSNFKSSMEGKNLENYMQCFVDSSFLKKKFRYFAVPVLVSQYPELNNWSIESERQYFQNLKTKVKTGQSVFLTLTPRDSTQSADSIFYQVDYSITVLSENQTINGKYAGSGQFKIFRDSRNQWVIVEWTDLLKDNSKSWSELKGGLY